MAIARNRTRRGLYWPRTLEYCFQNDTIRVGAPAPDQAWRRDAGELYDAAQLPVFRHRFRAVRRIRNPTQVSVYDANANETHNRFILDLLNRPAAVDCHDVVVHACVNVSRRDESGGGNSTLFLLLN